MQKQDKEQELIDNLIERIQIHTLTSKDMLVFSLSDVTPPELLESIHKRIKKLKEDIQKQYGFTPICIIKTKDVDLEVVRADTTER